MCKICKIVLILCSWKPFKTWNSSYKHATHQSTNQTAATAETWRFCTCERVWNVQTAGVKTKERKCLADAVRPSPLLHMAVCVRDHRVKYAAWLCHTAAQWWPFGESHDWWKKNHVPVFLQDRKEPQLLMSKPKVFYLMWHHSMQTVLRSYCGKRSPSLSQRPPDPLTPTRQHFPQI